MSAVKDVIFGSLIILYIISLYKLLKTENLRIKNIIKIILKQLQKVTLKNIKTLTLIPKNTSM